MSDSTEAAPAERHKSHGCSWKPGELVAGVEADGSFHALICVKERTFGPSGGRRTPAESVAITAPTWDQVCDEIEELGFDRPTVTEIAVRHGCHCRCGCQTDPEEARRRELLAQLRAGFAAAYGVTA